MSAAPDYCEPVVAWRMWYARESADGFRLGSIFHSTAWTPGEPLVAECRQLRLPFVPWRRPRHDAPAARCQCGIYAAPLGRLCGYLQEPQGFLRYPVLGRVSLWGTVVECQSGWRASVAYPERLYVPSVPELGDRADDLLGDLAAYGVPVALLRSRRVPAALDELAELEFACA